jgi:hypothetical protein
MWRERVGVEPEHFSSQLTANDDVAASAKFQLESIGVRWHLRIRLVHGTFSTIGSIHSL